MEFNISKVPFSRKGSWLAISDIRDTLSEINSCEGLMLRTTRGGCLHPALLHMDVMFGGNIVDYKIKATPSKLTLYNDKGAIEICFSDTKTIRFRGEGLTLRLRNREGNSWFEFIIPYNNEQYILNCAGARSRFALRHIHGKIDYDAPWKIKEAEYMFIYFNPGETGSFDIELKEYKSSWPQLTTPLPFEDCVTEIKDEFKAWLTKQPSVPHQYKKEQELAAYINWTSIVNPEGLITRETMFMSKNWMTRVWSWDHCFNAIALSYNHPDLAWDQIMTIFDHQDEQGLIPDCVTDVNAIWNFQKPPIHGWAIKKMMDNGAVDKKRLEEIYNPLCRWTDWWFKYRDYDNDGIPQYDHGNDSGWDNSTIFTLLPPVESPDLSAFLIIQMDVISEIADILGYTIASQSWKKRSESLLTRVLEHSLQDDLLVSLQSGTHEIIKNDSLIEFLPLLLGYRLPDPVRTKMINRLKNESFITEWGLATESTESPIYREDGYWQGPIWAPPTLMLIEGLKSCGEVALSREIAHKFLKLCQKSGFAENFNARTGDALKDPSYTWTSSIFMILAHEYR